MQKLKKESQRFSVTFDEGTSSLNRRYIVFVNVHGKDAKFWSLGLVHVYGTMPADKYLIVGLVGLSLRQKSDIEYWSRNSNIG